MIDVGGDDGAAAGDLAAHELRRHESRDGRAEALPVGEARFCLLGCALPPDILAMRDVDHLLGDDAGAGELELRHRISRSRSSIQPRAEAASPRSHVDGGVSIGVGARRVVDPERGSVRRARSRGTAPRHRHGLAARNRPCGFPQAARCVTFGGATSLAEIGLFIVRLPCGAGALALGQKPSLSLRRHDPDQVQRVSARASRRGRRTLSPFPGAPLGLIECRPTLSIALPRFALLERGRERSMRRARLASLAPGALAAARRRARASSPRSRDGNGRRLPSPRRPDSP